MARLSIVAPVFREAKVLPELYSRVCAALLPVTLDFELVLVSDGGNDGSWETIEELSAADPRVKGIKFTRNFGQHLAISAGLDVCDGDWVVVMDSDLQDRPEVIPQLFAKAQAGYEVVFVSRKDRPEPRLYQAAARVFYWLFRFLAKTNYDPAHGNFSIISRRVVERYRAMGETLRFYGGILDWLGFERTSIEASHGERFAGEAGYNLRKRLKLAGEIILAHSDRPLHLSVLLGLVISLFSGATGCFMIVRSVFFQRYAVEGWTSLMVAFFFMSGIILLVLGIIGTYIGKIFNEIKRRPLYVVGDSVGFEQVQDAVRKPVMLRRSASSQ
jgi:glycosyltransferase involved in cell wall biosynthesis